MKVHVWALRSLGLYGRPTSGLGALPLTLDPGSWYFPYSLTAMRLFTGVAVYGFVISLGGPVAFEDPVLD